MQKSSKVTRDSLKCVVHGLCFSFNTIPKVIKVIECFCSFLAWLVFQGPQWAAGTLTEELKERWQQVRITVEGCMPPASSDTMTMRMAGN